MKKITLFILLVAFLGANSVQAQPQSSEKIKTMKVAYITNKLELTPKESQNFWPVYNEYQEKLELLRLDKRKNIVGASNKSDAELEKMILAQFDLQEKEVKIHREYYQKLKKVVSIQKIVALKKAEQDFKKYLLQQAREKRTERMQQRRQRDNFRN